MYDSTAQQARMNFDVRRNQHYLNALLQSLRPGDRVLDLGAGLGMLGLMASRHGAGAVHLVEPRSSIQIARQVARDTGLTNCHFHQADIDSVVLDGPVDIILSVFTGNFLLTEDLLPFLFRTRDRLLAPGGKLIPDRGKMLVQPVTCEDYYRGLTRYLETETFGIDYQALRKYLLNSAYYDHFNKIEFEPLGPAATLLELDFTTATSTTLDETADMTITGNGQLHGWLGWSDIRLGQNWLGTSPREELTHWRQVFFPLPEPVPVKNGETVSVRFQRPPLGDWAWTTTHGNNRWKQSTFYSRPPELNALSKLAQDFKPSINERGRATLFALENFRGNKTVPEIGREMSERFPEEFPDPAAAIEWVRKLVKSYS